MYQINFSKPIHVHFIGIGGISMSGLAKVLLDRGFTVSGSDRQKSPLTLSLESEGATVRYGQRADNITEDIDVVVYTAAIGKENPELSRAIELGIPLLTRAELLGQMMKNYHDAIAVAGTHGKTTTTSMIAQILIDSQKDPTVSVGGILPSIGGNIRIGASGLFLTEACEYTNSFLSFFPTVGIILNMEADHLDFFKDIHDIRHSFRRFAELLPFDGCLIINADTPHYEDITLGLDCHIITFSLEKDADYTARDISWDSYGHASFTVYHHDKKLGSFYLKVPGKHNISNTLAAIACARIFHIPTDDIVKALSSFTGAERRFEYKGTVGGATIIDDYAHHPTEIEATLSAAANYPHRKLWCVFQPHTYSRTQALLDDFAKALSAADEIILAPIYAAREANTIGISSQDLADRITALGASCRALPSFDDIETYLLANCEKGDLILVMGAGDIVQVGEHLLGR